MRVYHRPWITGYPRDDAWAGYPRFELPADDPVADEVAWARGEVYGAGLEAISGSELPEAEQVRREYSIRQKAQAAGPNSTSATSDLQKTLLDAARMRANELRLSGRIGDDAFRLLEADLDWSELQASALD